MLTSILQEKVKDDLGSEIKGIKLVAKGHLSVLCHSFFEDPADLFIGR